MSSLQHMFLEKQSLYSFWFYVFWENYLYIISNKKIITQKKSSGVTIM